MNEKTYHEIVAISDKIQHFGQLVGKFRNHSKDLQKALLVELRLLINKLESLTSENEENVKEKDKE